MEQAGSRMFRVVRSIKDCRIALIEWNNRVKGNIKVKIQEIKKKLKAAREGCDPSKRGDIANLKRQLCKAYKDEELFWSQKSRNRWLKEGDKNTTFFHISVMTKRKKNKISLLQKLKGDWCRSDQEIEENLCNHYRELFTTTNPKEFDKVLQGIPRTISSLMNEQLIKHVEKAEIQQALSSMFPNKAPGVDGMSSLFFSKLLAHY